MTCRRGAVPSQWRQPRRSARQQRAVDARAGLAPHSAGPVPDRREDQRRMMQWSGQVSIFRIQLAPGPRFALLRPVQEVHPHPIDNMLTGSFRDLLAGIQGASRMYGHASYVEVVAHLFVSSSPCILWLHSQHITPVRPHAVAATQPPQSAIYLDSSCRSATWARARSASPS